jgi:trimeric autotransporter adhesin
MADGDSITAGSGASTPYTDHMTLTLPWNIINWGVPGETCLTMIQNAPNNIDSKFRAGDKNVVVLQCGENDAAGGATAAQIYARMQTYCNARHAAGFKCLVWTEISRVGFDTEKNAINSLLASDHSFTDGLIDFTGTPLGVDGGYSNLTYFQSDQIHPNQFSINTIEAPTVAAVVNALP